MTAAHPIFAKWPAQHPEWLQLFTAPTPNGVKPSIMLEECGLPYEAHRIDIMANMSGSDEERLVQLISNHHTYTGSTRAKEILDNWAAYRTKFVKVMPVEYRRALQEMDRLRTLQAAE